ncbi:MAG: BTAD domain-containing putative transcriptional regulator [Caldilineaceae bacterium]
MAHLTLSFFGSFQATLTAQPLRSLQSGRLQALLAYLALEGERPHTRNELAARFWPDEADPVAKQNLRQALYQLRQALDAAAQTAPPSPPFLLLTRDSVQFNQASDYTLDVTTFGEKIKAQQWEEAVALYQGELLDGLAGTSPLFEEWLVFMREQLHMQALAALAQLTEQALQTGSFTQAQHYGRRQLALEPWREAAHRQVMLALAYSGDRPAALVQYASCRQLLWEELGVEPDAETERLAAQIRAGALHTARDELPTSSLPQGVTSAREPDQTEQTNRPAASSQQPTATIDWGEAPEVAVFHGRQTELTTLESWLVHERCRLVSVAGMGGMGKTALAARVTQQVAGHFEVVIWRSLLNAPPLEEVVQSWLRLLDEPQHVQPPPDLTAALTRLFGHLQARRCLLILDNVESILQNDGRAGHYHPGYAPYGQLFKRLGETSHQSALLLTSREAPPEVMRLERERRTVQSLALGGLTPEAGQALLRRQGLTLARDAVDLLVAHYSGNPLALMLVGETIQELFDGDVGAFLEQPLIFEDIRDVLDQQWQRLAPLERDLLLWLAIEREPLTLAQLSANLAPPVPMTLLLEAVNSLRRRALLEREIEANHPADAHQGHGFLLQNVVTEYLTALFVEQICRELEAGTPQRLQHHALIKAQAKEYVRQSQRRLILQPIAERMRSRLGEVQLAAQLNQSVTHLHTTDGQMAGYGAGNLLNLLLQLDFDVAAYDFTGLTLRQADLTGAVVHGADWRGCHFDGCRFTDKFATITALTFSADGRQLVAGTAVGNIRRWRVADGQPLGVWPAHTNFIFSTLVSPDGATLYSGSDDQLICAWDLDQAGDLLLAQPPLRYSVRGHQRGVWRLALSRDGRRLASAGGDGDIVLWEAATGVELARFHEHARGTRAVAIDPNGEFLAAGGEEGLIVVWHITSGAVVARLHEQRSSVLALAFSPDGMWLASGNQNHTICLYQLGPLRGRIIAATHNPAAPLDALLSLPSQTLLKHTGSVTAVAFSADSALLASSSADQTVCLWRVADGQPHATLYGHSDEVTSIAFSPTGALLASGSADRTLCLWDVVSGQLLQRLYGHAQGVMGLALTADGTVLASAHQDQQVRLWDATQRRLTRALPLHHNEVTCVAWQPGGKLLASGSIDHTIHLWDLASGQSHKVLRGHTGWLRMLRFSRDGAQLISCCSDWSIRRWQVASGALLQTIEPGYSVWAIALSPDEETLAFGGTQGTVQLLRWPQGDLLLTLHGHTNWVTALAYSPDGVLLASGGSDQQVRLWDAQSGHCHHTLQGHSSWIYAMAFSPDGALLATAGADRTICLWDVQDHRLLYTLCEHKHEVRALLFTPDSRTLISGSVDDTIRWWDVATGQCLTILQAPRPYEGMQIAGATGLTPAQVMTLEALGAVTDLTPTAVPLA